jgi:salicylate hydroxylase
MILLKPSWRRIVAQKFLRLENESTFCRADNFNKVCDQSHWCIHNACMQEKIIVVGGGIGGLAAALACARTGGLVQVLERSPVFAEVGAGIQLGPNVVRVLQGWGLGERLKAVAAFPAQLEVRNACSAELLAVLPLGQKMVQRYGAPYATIARADLHSMLLLAASQSGSVELTLDAEVTAITQDSRAVQVQLAANPALSSNVLRAEVMVGADGLWSRVRSQVLPGGAPRATGHLAYRAMVPQKDLVPALRSQVITAWLGPDFHIVQYPVRGGEWLNVVAIVHGEVRGDPAEWNHSANADELQAKLANAQAPLRDLIQALPDWRLWALSDRPPMRSATEQAKGRIALLGDAAHPMRPYLAQGAGMAIEDAAELANVLAVPGRQVPAALQRYARRRWARNARVQASSIRNGEIFHLSGLMRLGRDWSLKLLGRHLLDVPWLYRGSRR